jgi:hypothetical protein
VLSGENLKKKKKHQAQYTIFKYVSLLRVRAGISVRIRMIHPSFSEQNRSYEVEIDTWAFKFNSTDGHRDLKNCMKSTHSRSLSIVIHSIFIPPMLYRYRSANMFNSHHLISPTGFHWNCAVGLVFCFSLQLMNAFVLLLGWLIVYGRLELLIPQ